MSKLKLEKFLELLGKCDKDSDLEIVTPQEGVIDDWSRIQDIVQIDENHVINYWKASKDFREQKRVRIVLK